MNEKSFFHEIIIEGRYCRLISICGVLLTILPIIIGFFSIIIFAVDVPMWDQLDVEISPVAKYYEGTLSPSDFLLIHNDHRPIIPLFVIVFSHIVTGMNIIVVDFLSYIIFISMFVGLLTLLKKNISNNALFWTISIPLSWYIFNPYLLVSFFYGIQIYYSIMLAFLILGLWSLEKSTWFDKYFIGGICCAFACFFSFSAGMFVWPALFVLILVQKTHHRIVKVCFWIGAACASFLLNYVILGFSKSGIHGTDGYSQYLVTFFNYPFQKCLCFLGAIGSNIIHNELYAYFPGLVILASIFFIFINNYSDLHLEDTAKWYVLITFGLFVSLALTITRSGHGDVFGPAHQVLYIADMRHFPGTILFLPAIFLLITSYLAKSIDKIQDLSYDEGMFRRVFQLSGNVFLFGLVLLLIFFGIGFHLIPGIGLAYQWNHNQYENQQSFIHYQSSSDEQLEKMHYSAESVRMRAKVMEDKNLGVFRTDWITPEKHPVLEKLQYFNNITFR